jgi:hypothetical protein
MLYNKEFFNRIDPNRTFGHVVRRLRLIALKYIPELTTASDWPDSMLRETAQ